MVPSRSFGFKEARCCTPLGGPEVAALAPGTPHHGGAQRHSPAQPSLYPSALLRTLLSRLVEALLAAWATSGQPRSRDGPVVRSRGSTRRLAAALLAAELLDALLSWEGKTKMLCQLICQLEAGPDLLYNLSPRPASS